MRIRRWHTLRALRKKGDDITQVLRSQATLKPAYYKVQPATRVSASLANRSRMFHVEQRINASTTKQLKLRLSECKTSLLGFAEREQLHERSELNASPNHRITKSPTKTCPTPTT